jgi:hypothetical protein
MHRGGERAAANTAAERVSSVGKRYFSERELSIYAGLATRTLQSWRLRGQGPPWVKLCGAVRYSIEQFDAWAGACPGGGERSR